MLGGPEGRPRDHPIRGGIVKCPWLNEHRPWPCGRCWCCRVTRQRQRAARMVLEHRYGGVEATFLTLTYRDEEIPLRIDHETGECWRELDKEAPPKFIRSMRKRLDLPLRYVAVGEYGGRTERPHYHIALYGLPPGIAVWGPDGTFKADPKRNGVNQQLMPRHNWISEVVWQKGGVDVGVVNDASSLYLARYTLKKLSNPEEDELEGRPPQFSRWSSKPAIGAPAVPYIASGYDTPSGRKWIEENGDIVPLIRIDGRVWPMDRTISNLVRDELGLARRHAEREYDRDELLPRRALELPTPEEKGELAAREAQGRRRERQKAALVEL